ncbi:CHASE2 domain-containing protein [Phormidium nigroviride]
MISLVVLNLGKGDLHNGFPFVTAWLQSQNIPQSRQITGSLPTAPDILDLYRRWQLLYELLYQARSLTIRRRQPQPIDEDIEIDDSDVTHVCDADFYEVSQELQNRIDTWLDSEGFSDISRQLYKQLDSAQEIRVIIQTEDNQLRKLPWYTWRFFRDYPLAEVSLSSLNFEPGKAAQNSAKQVRILAILGDSAGIDIEADKRLLENLKDAQTVFLVEPQRRELNEQLWDSQGWDILFFAGHSSTQADGGSGQIYINPTESLTITQLKNALNEAIARGLQLAIFNSCDGLGLARQLADLHIPQMIVMREPVPDLVAQEFLKYFLTEFAGGRSFDLAVRKARERLQGIEGEFPGASWLPVTFQNPAEVPPNWNDFLNEPESPTDSPQPIRQSTPTSSRQRGLWRVLLASLAVTGLVMGGRAFGLLQSWELKAFDQLVRLRPNERQDSRLLVVAITESDFQLPEQKSRKGSLSDLALARLLEKLESYQPRAIGLDIYRDFPVDPNQPELATRLKNSNRIFAICKVSERKLNEPGISSPPEIPTERQGFSDLVKDPDGIIRRHLIAMNPNAKSACTTPNALSAQLAFRYLKAEGMEAKYTNKNQLQVGKVIFKRLQVPMGGYQKVDDSGYQILLNYRPVHYRSPVADTVTLNDILTDKVPPDAVKDRIVLIGVTAQSDGDYFPTPYSAGQEIYQEMPGVIVHAQMVSQILSAVLDERPLLWVWSQWGETLWVWGWSLFGGVLAWRIRNSLRLGLAGGATLGVLYGLSFGLICQGGWVPLVPSALALVVTGGSVVSNSRIQKVKPNVSYD